jgi:hypothetical protein
MIVAITRTQTHYFRLKPVYNVDINVVLFPNPITSVSKGISFQMFRHEILLFRLRFIHGKRLHHFIS